MRAGFDMFPALYEAIVQESAKSDNKIQIFVSTFETDSLCALQIFQKILSNEGKAFSVFPVSSYEQIKAVTDSIPREEGSDTSNVILLNCGACEDVLEVLQPGENVRITVVDSRRPIHHNSLAAPAERLVVISADEDVQLWGTDALPRADGESEAEEEEDDGDESKQEDEEEAVSGAKRKRGTDWEQRSQRRRAVRKARADYYGAGSFWARPSTLAFLDLAVGKRLEDREALWLAAVALSDHLIHQRMSAERYQEYAHDLHDQIRTKGYDVERRIAIEVAGVEGTAGVNMISSPATRIEPVEDYIFPLLRHWTLYAAMQHCPYVAARLKSFTEAGQKRLRQLLAYMGYWPGDYNNPFTTMRMRLVEKMSSKLRDVGSQHGLNDLWLPGFLLRWGYENPVSATDAALLTTAILECDEHRWSDDLPFWRGLRALDPTKGKLDAEGIDVAKTVQQAILKAAGGALVDRKVWACRLFFYVDLSEETMQHRAIFKSPAALLRLGTFVRDRKAWSEPAKKDMAVVVIGPQDEEGHCLIVCTPRRLGPADQTGNRIPLLLQEAAEKLSIDAPCLGFDTAVRRVPAKSATNIVHEMQLIAIHHA